MHKTVLKNETIDLLNIKPNGIYVDVTLGGGGHSLEIAKKLDKEGVLVCFDLDEKNIDSFKPEIESLDKNIILVRDNFANIASILEERGIESVDGILADLGWSSDQLSSIPGLSFQDDFEELDMRLSSDFGVKAKDLLNGLSKKELSKMFEDYADIRGSQNQRLVSSILGFRKNRAFESVGDLKQAIDRSFSSESTRGQNEKRNSDYARVFQSLRIAVNNEINNLKEFLSGSFKVLKSDGILALITFHSGEERVAKSFFNTLIEKKDATFLSTQYGENFTRPSVEELTENLRARSAKLWVIRKLK